MSQIKVDTITDGAGTGAPNFPNSISVAGAAVSFPATRTDWNNTTAINGVVGQLAWKNYGNNHTIFDASASTSPSGTAIDNTNSVSPWTGTYPTLMGWNGAQTYGVRVDSARIADSVATDGFAAVGSYAFLTQNANYTWPIDQGSNYTGSQLAYGAMYGEIQSYGVLTWNPTSPPGTWRAMGGSNINGAAIKRVTLFVRIA